MRDGQQPELRPSALCSPRSPNKPRECAGKCRQFNGFGLIQAGSGPGGRRFKSKLRADRCFFRMVAIAYDLNHFWVVQEAAFGLAPKD
jgi:hypothetical protein